MNGSVRSFAPQGYHRVDLRRPPRGNESGEQGAGGHYAGPKTWNLRVITLDAAQPAHDSFEIVLPLIEEIKKAKG